MIFTGEAVAIVLGGNIAYGFNQAGISWRAVPLGLAVVCVVISAALAFTIREPPKGRFVVQAVRFLSCSSVIPQTHACHTPCVACMHAACPRTGGMRTLAGMALEKTVPGAGGAAEVPAGQRAVVPGQHAHLLAACHRSR